MSESFIQKCLELGLRIRDHNFDDYLKDESRFTGHADALITAREDIDVINAILVCNETNTPITVASGKTSLTGAPVPLGGAILDVKNLNSMNSNAPNRVGPGAIVKDYKEFVDALGLFYPPDPTSEGSCTIGGNVACNASGALSYLYGPTRDYIQGLRVVLPAGTILTLERGRVCSEKGTFRIPRSLLDPTPKDDLLIPAPSWKTTPWNILKNTAGFYSADPMDLLDLFIGSEGILGVIVEVTTRLLNRRKPFFSLIIYIPDRDTTVRLVKTLNDLKNTNSPFSQDRGKTSTHKEPHPCDFPVQLNYTKFGLILPSCMEWFGHSTSTLLPKERRHYLESSYGAIFVEQEYEDQEQMLAAASQWADLIEEFNLSYCKDAKLIQTEVALDGNHARNFRNLRSSIPDKLNELIRPGFIKIGSDFSVPSYKLEHLLKLYDQGLPGESSYVFGHIGNAHLHANIVPETNIEEQSARRIMTEMSREVVSLGGSIAGEHGIGKIKSKFLEMAVGEDTITQMKNIKKQLDPNNILNRHTLLSDLNP